MKLVDEIKERLEKSGYELLKPESKRCMVNNKEIIIRNESEERVELEPHIFEGDDIKEHLSDFEVSEHEPEVVDIHTGERHKSYYSLIVERKH